MKQRDLSTVIFSGLLFCYASTALADSVLTLAFTPDRSLEPSAISPEGCYLDAGPPRGTLTALVAAGSRLRLHLGPRGDQDSSARLLFGGDSLFPESVPIPNFGDSGITFTIRDPEESKALGNALGGALPFTLLLPLLAIAFVRKAPACRLRETVMSRRNIAFICAALLLAACDSQGLDAPNGDRSLAAVISGAGKGKCLAPIQGGNTTVTSEVVLGCFGCTVADENNVIDSDPASYGSVNLAVGTLESGGVIRVTAQPGVAFPAGEVAGALVEFAAAAPLSADVLPRIDIRTFLGATRVDYFSFQSAAYGDLADSPLSQENRFYLGRTTTGTFDAVEIYVSSTIVSAQTTVRVFSLCSNGTEGDAYPGVLPGGY